MSDSPPQANLPDPETSRAQPNRVNLTWALIIVLIGGAAGLGICFLKSHKSRSGATPAQSSSTPLLQQTLSDAAIQIHLEMDGPTSLFASKKPGDFYAHSTFALGKANGPLLFWSTDSYKGQPNSDSETFHAGGALDPTLSRALDKPLSELTNALFIQIGVGAAQPFAKLRRGHITVTLNNQLRLDFDVPPQNADATGNLFVRDLTAGLSLLHN